MLKHIHITIVILLLAGCGGRSGGVQEAGTGTLTCSGAEPGVRINGVGPAATAVTSNPGPPMSCCMSAGLVFNNTITGGKFEEVHVTFIQSVGSSTPPPTTMELDKLNGWRILVRYYPCSPPSSGCQSSTLDSTVDAFTGTAQFKGKISKSGSTLNHCQHASRKSATPAVLKSVDLYVKDAPLTWF